MKKDQAKMSYVDVYIVPSASQVSTQQQISKGTSNSTRTLNEFKQMLQPILFSNQEVSNAIVLT